MMRYLRDEDIADAVCSVKVHKGWMVDLTEVASAISAIPAADVVEARHGQKIDITSADDFFHWCKCSECGYDGLFLEDEYCSRCGAKLDVPVTNVGEMGGDGE